MAYVKPELRSGFPDNRARAKQLISFQGLSRNGAGFTDIDGICEYKNKAYVMFEVKYADKTLQKGQKLLMQRFVADMYRAGKKSLAMLLRHQVHECGKDVYACELYVDKLFMWNDKEWITPHKPVTAAVCIDKFFSIIDGA